MITCGVASGRAEASGNVASIAAASLGETAAPAVDRGLLWRRCGTSRRRRDRRRPPSPARAPDRERDADQHEDDESGGDPKGGCNGEIERPRKAVHRAPQRTWRTGRAPLAPAIAAADVGAPAGIAATREAAPTPSSRRPAPPS